MALAIVADRAEEQVKSKQDYIDDLERYVGRGVIETEMSLLLTMTGRQLACVERLMHDAASCAPVAPERNLKKAFR